MSVSDSMLTAPVVDVAHSQVVATFARTVYPLEAMYGAAYAMIDRCYVRLDAPDTEHVAVILRAKEALSETELQALGGELGNELLAQSWRLTLIEKNQESLRRVTAQALLGAAGIPSVPDLSGLDEGADAFDDPLGIAVPWEEKYGNPQGSET